MPDHSEARLIEKLRAIEALHARPGTAAEGQAAANARERIRQRLEEAAAPPDISALPIEYRFSMPDVWSRRVFVALLRRYGIQPYRFAGQRRTTVMAKVTRRFVDETLWPQYTAVNTELREYLSEVTDRVVATVIHEDLTEPGVVDEPAQLGIGFEPAPAAAEAPTVPRSPSPPA
jgi:hypothetical protein